MNYFDYLFDYIICAKVHTHSIQTHCKEPHVSLGECMVCCVPTPGTWIRSSVLTSGSCTVEKIYKIIVKIGDLLKISVVKGTFMEKKNVAP